VPNFGAAGTFAATKELDAADAGPVPTPLIAATVQVYVLAAVSAETKMGELAPVTVLVTPALLDVQMTL
jgi:hypothetical protein